MSGAPFGRDKRFGLGVVVSDMFGDGGNEFAHSGEDAAADSFGGDVREEAFDDVQPGR
jgi:hypothetical protein